LQKKTGLTYQQALQRVRALGERPAELRRETGWPLEVCDRFLVDGHAPIPVVEQHDEAAALEATEASRNSDAVWRVCAALRMNAAAQTVLLVDALGHVMVRVGGELDLAALEQAAMPVKRRSSSGYARITAVRAMLIVGFSRDETSLGLVRLRMAKAVAELERLLADVETPTMPPIGGGGPSGIPNELRVVVPVPEERPPKKPTPIGRKRKRDR
jgi:hypothetical protein